MRWLSHAIYYFYHYFCLSLLWSLYCLFIILHNAMNVPWQILLLPLFLHVFTLVIVLSFYNPSQCDECPMTYITSTTISACLWPLYCLFITLHRAMNVPWHILLAKVKTDRNSGRNDICHGTFTALWRVIKRQYNDQSKDRQK
jgi:hypothetical protein